MSTFLARAEDLVGTLSDTTAVSDWLSAGAKYLIDLLPEDKADRMTSEVTDAGSGISVTGHRVFSAYKSGYRAPIKDEEEYARYVDANSRFYATSITPVAYILNGLLFVKPGGGTGKVIAYPTVVHGDTTITGFPTEWEQAVVLYAGIQGALAKLQSATLVYTNWATYAETNKDIELAQEERAKLNLQLEEAKTNVEIAKLLVESLNAQFKMMLITIGVK